MLSRLVFHLRFPYEKSFYLCGCFRVIHPLLWLALTFNTQTAKRWPRNRRTYCDLSPGTLLFPVPRLVAMKNAGYPQITQSRHLPQTDDFN
jgi:hypothetical protein